MSNTNLFEEAARNKFRFPSIKGPLTVEDLLELKLKSTDGCDLDTIAKAINKELKSETEESFVSITPNPRKKPLEQKLELVKYIIEVKQEEIKQAKDRADRKDRRQKLLTAIASKEDAVLQGASLAKLQKELASLED